MRSKVLFLVLTSLNLTACLTETAPADGARQRVSVQKLGRVCAIDVMVDTGLGTAEAYNFQEAGWKPLMDGTYTIVQDPMNTGDTFKLGAWFNQPNDDQGLIPPAIHARQVCEFQVSEGLLVSIDSDPSLNTLVDQFDDDSKTTTLKTLDLELNDDYEACNRVIHDDYCGSPSPAAVANRNNLLIK